METLFFLKKVIGSLLAPVPLVVLLLLVGVYLHFVKKNYRNSGRFFLAAVVLLLVFSVPVIPSSMLRPLETEFPAFNDPPIKVDNIMVLGGWNNEDEKLPGISRISSYSLYRAVEAYRLSRVYPEATVVLSGHKINGFELSHPDYMADFLISLGLDPGRIIIRSGSRDTESEALLVKELALGKNNLLVTSANHMERAVNIFDSAGIEVIPVPVGHLTSRGKSISYHIFTPDADALELSEALVYETLGSIWFAMKGWLSGE
ncbi:YdcF family protein [Hahella ganghwensis]|uniref:YdcF family protein n=1 Tax=Hahella ganghwensis TaxID=286420 RepID=UPI00037195B0|nr:ElyC/SanA/YdcF family protein [Hahella ganghwensis]